MINEVAARRECEASAENRVANSTETHTRCLHYTVRRADEDPGRRRGRLSYDSLGKVVYRENSGGTFFWSTPNPQPGRVKVEKKL
jgi:hypothetical protein